MRNTFSEKNIMNNFLKEHAYILSQISSWGSNIIIHPLRSIMDVSVLGGAPSIPWCSSLALRLIWWCLVGCWGWGSCRRQTHWKTGTPPRGEGTLILNCWSWWLGPAITRWQVNIPFCVKDVSLLWGRLFLRNCVSHSVTDEEWAITDQKVEPTTKQLWLPRQRNSVSTDARTTARNSYSV